MIGSGRATDIAVAGYIASIFAVITNLPLAGVLFLLSTMAFAWDIFTDRD